MAAQSERTFDDLAGRGFDACLYRLVTGLSEHQPVRAQRLQGYLHRRGARKLALDQHRGAGRRGSDGKGRGLRHQFDGSQVKALLRFRGEPVPVVAIPVEPGRDLVVPQVDNAVEPAPANQGAVQKKLCAGGKGLDGDGAVARLGLEIEFLDFPVARDFDLFGNRFDAAAGDTHGMNAAFEFDLDPGSGSEGGLVNPEIEVDR